MGHSSVATLNQHELKQIRSPPLQLPWLALGQGPWSHGPRCALRKTRVEKSTCHSTPEPSFECVVRAPSKSSFQPKVSTDSICMANSMQGAIVNSSSWFLFVAYRWVMDPAHLMGQ